MKIGNYEVKIGEKSNIFIGEGRGVEAMPCTVISSSPSPVVLVTAGVHNSEYIGIKAAMKLIEEIQPEHIEGTLIIVPVVNVSGFEHRTISKVYEDGKNLNRCFPGSKDGSVAERIAYAMEEELFSLADYYIDLHSGDDYEALIPYVYYANARDEETKEKSKKMASLTDVAYTVLSPILSSGAYNYATSLNIPSILLERGCMGIVSDEQVYQDVEDVKRILADVLGYKCSVSEMKNEKKIHFDEVIYDSAPCFGIWEPKLNIGDEVKKGQLLGVIKDYRGDILSRRTAQCDGIILYQVESLNILEGDVTVAYGCKK